MKIKRIGLISLLVMMAATIVITRFNHAWWPGLFNVTPRGFPIAWQPWTGGLIARLVNLLFAIVVITGLGFTIEHFADRRFAILKERLGWISTSAMLVATALATHLNLATEQSIFCYGRRGAPFTWWSYTSAGVHYHWWALVWNILIAIASVAALGLCIEALEVRWRRKIPEFFTRQRL